MKVIVEKEICNKIVGDIKESILIGKRIPDKVFKESFKYFSFVAFDDLFIPELCFSSIKKMLSKTGESHFWLSSVCPESINYYHTLFGFCGTVKFSLSDNESDFLSAVTEYPEESPADALIHNSRVLAISSQSSSWVLYADRNSEIAIFAFKDKELADILSSIYPDGIFSDAEAAADYMFEDSTQDREIRASFLENYS